MALGTAGTAATTTLTALNAFTAESLAVDVGTLANLILNDINPAHPRWPGAFSRNGLLYIPNRGVLRVLPGDTIAVDNRGWPVLVSAYAMAGANWV
jgi:hypothetical protein